MTAVVIFACTVVWWPLDPLVMPNAETVAGFSTFRTLAVITEVLGFVIMMWAPMPPRLTIAACVVLYSMFLASVGYGLGAAGTEDLGWFGDAIIGVIPLSFLPMTLKARIPASMLAGAALAVPFFVLHPGNLAAPAALGQVSFLGFAVGFSVAVGEVWYRVTRRSFFEQRAIEKVNGQLEDLTATLSEQVAERTETLRALAGHLDDVQEAERRRLAHDLHDDLGQQLTAMRYTVARLDERLPSDTNAEELVEDLTALLDGTVSSMRAVISRLRPRILDDLGLIPAVEWLCEEVEGRSGIACALTLEPGATEAAEQLPAAAELAMFRAVQEGTTNALKHGRPTRLDVRLAARDGSLEMTVKDDGPGLAEAGTTGFGLLGLRERFRELGGGCEVGNAAPKGAELRASIPMGAG